MARQGRGGPVALTGQVPLAGYMRINRPATPSRASSVTAAPVLILPTQPRAGAAAIISNICSNPSSWQNGPSMGTGECQGSAAAGFSSIQAATIRAAGATWRCAAIAPSCGAFGRPGKEVRPEPCRTSLLAVARPLRLCAVRLLHAARSCLRAGAGHQQPHLPVIRRHRHVRGLRRDPISRRGHRNRL